MTDADKQILADMRLDLLVETVKAHAQTNYEKGGWDFVVETFEDREIREVLVRHGATTKQEAIRAMKEIVDVLEDRRAGAGWG